MSNDFVYDEKDKTLLRSAYIQLRDNEASGAFWGFVWFSASYVLLPRFFRLNKLLTPLASVTAGAFIYNLYNHQA